jgi:hypothetical protein
VWANWQVEGAAVVFYSGPDEAMTEVRSRSRRRRMILHVDDSGGVWWW